MLALEITSINFLGMNIRTSFLLVCLNVFVTMHLISQSGYSKIIPLNVGSYDFSKQVELHDDLLYISTDHTCNNGTPQVTHCTSLSIFNIEGELLDSIQSRNLGLGNHDIFEFQDESKMLLVGYGEDPFSSYQNKLKVLETNKSFSLEKYTSLELDSLNVETFFLNGILKRNDEYLLYGNGRMMNDPYPKGFILNYDLGFQNLNDFKIIEHEIPENHVIDLMVSTNGNLIFANLNKSLINGRNPYLLTEMKDDGSIIRTFVSDSVGGASVNPRMARMENGDYVMTKQIQEIFNKLELICIRNDDFSLRWKNVFDIQSNPDDKRITISELIGLSNGDVLAVGRQTLYFQEDNRMTGYLKRVNEFGETVWEKNYVLRKENGEHQESQLHNVIELPDGSIIAVGNIGLRTPDNLQDDDLWILKLGADGCMDLDDCGEEIVELSTSTIEVEIQNNDIKIYPNPTNGEINIELYEGGFTKLEMYNQLGVKIKTVGLHKSNQKVVLEDAGPGLYYFNFRNNTGKSVMKKVIKYEN